MGFLHARFPDINESQSICNLDVTLDPDLSFSDHVNRITRTCLYHLSFNQYLALQPAPLMVSQRLLKYLPHSGYSTLAFLAKAHSVQKSNAYVQLSGRVNPIIPPDIMHLVLFTPWSILSSLGCQRPPHFSLHVQCYCSIQKFRLCRPLKLEPASFVTTT